MKRILITVVILSMLASSPAFAAEGSEGGQNDVYRSLSLTLLSPYVDKAIDDFYGEYLKYLPREDTWDYRVQSIEKPHPGDFFYTVKLEVLPYVGPHLTVGRDRITLRIDNRGKVESVQLEHLESHELPSYYQDMIKKKLLGT